LLIEDNAANRQSKVELLKLIAGRGPVVAVEGSDEAIRAIRALPRFDLIVADINLPRPGDRHAEENKDGISFARWLRRTGYPAVLAGYSAHFEEAQLPAADRSLFTGGFLFRGEVAREIRRSFREWMEKADAVREELRARPLPRNSEVFPHENEVNFSEGVYSLDVIDLADERAIKELLDDGFTVKLALPKGSQAARPFFVWYRQDDTGAFVEVFGQPFLYAEAPTLAEAEEQISVLMTGMLADLRDEDPDTLGPAVLNLRKFLKEVFGE
jgi:CheY-like chemotaxis protein